MRTLNAVLTVVNVALAALALFTGNTNLLIWSMGIACICAVCARANDDSSGR